VSYTSGATCCAQGCPDRTPELAHRPVVRRAIGVRPGDRFGQTAAALRLLRPGRSGQPGAVCRKCTSRRTARRAPADLCLWVVDTRLRSVCLISPLRSSPSRHGWLRESGLRVLIRAASGSTSRRPRLGSGRQPCTADLYRSDRHYASVVPGFPVAPRRIAGPITNATAYVLDSRARLYPLVSLGELQRRRCLSVRLPGGPAGADRRESSVPDPFQPGWRVPEPLPGVGAAGRASCVRRGRTTRSRCNGHRIELGGGRGWPAGAPVVAEASRYPVLEPEDQSAARAGRLRDQCRRPTARTSVAGLGEAAPAHMIPAVVVQVPALR